MNTFFCILHMRRKITVTSLLTRYSLDSFVENAVVLALKTEQKDSNNANGVTREAIDAQIKNATEPIKAILDRLCTQLEHRNNFLSTSQSQ